MMMLSIQLRMQWKMVVLSKLPKLQSILGTLSLLEVERITNLIGTFGKAEL